MCPYMVNFTQNLLFSNISDICVIKLFSFWPMQLDIDIESYMVYLALFRTFFLGKCGWNWIEICSFFDISQERCLSLVFTYSLSLSGPTKVKSRGLYTCLCKLLIATIFSLNCCEKWIRVFLMVFRLFCWKPLCGNWKMQL